MRFNVMKDPVANFLTLDVEEWFDAEIPRRKLAIPPDENTAIEKQVDLFRDICERLEIKCTCFVLGKLAEKKPHIVKKLQQDGHEIASHSYAHRLVYSLSPAEFRDDLHRSISILEDLTGENVKGFRAPSLSVNADCADWFYKILEQEKIAYSSSVYPAKTFLYGMPEAAPYVHRVQGTTLVEIPQQVLNLGFLKTGVAGGAFMRLLPAWFVKAFIRRKNKKGFPVFVYLHPWELIFQKYPVRLTIMESIIEYVGIKRNSAKIDAICRSLKGSFVRMDHFVASFEGR